MALNKIKKSMVDGLPEELSGLTEQLAQKAKQLNLKNNHTLFFAHRGAEAKAPENTYKAIQLAFEMGFDGSEFDVQVTSDGQWVLMHDETVDRTTNGTGQIKNMTLEQVRALNIDAGNFVSWHMGLKVPLLKDILTLAKKYNKKVYIEVKSYNNDNDLVNLANMINTLGIYDTAWVLGHYDLSNKLRTLNLNVKSSISYIDNADFYTALENKNVVAVEVYPHTLVTTQLIDTLRSYGKLVTTGTIRTLEDAQNLIDLGVDVVGGDIHHA